MGVIELLMYLAILRCCRKTKQAALRSTGLPEEAANGITTSMAAIERVMTLANIENRMKTDKSIADAEATLRSTGLPEEAAKGILKAITSSRHVTEYQRVAVNIARAWTVLEAQTLSRIHAALVAGGTSEHNAEAMRPEFLTLIREGFGLENCVAVATMVSDARAWTVLEAQTLSRIHAALVAGGTSEHDAEAMRPEFLTLIREGFGLEDCVAVATMVSDDNMRRAALGAL